MSRVIKVTSGAVTDGGRIPVKYTCDGPDVSPPLAWSGVPDGTKSIALICDDPDAPIGTWVHWVLYGISPDTGELPEGVAKDKVVLAGAMQGKNDFRRIGYGGPCPPPGAEHRYYFRIYALDCKINLPAGITRSQLLEAMKGHVIAEGQLMGKYSRLPGK